MPLIGRRVQRGNLRDKFSPAVSATPFSPPVSAIPKIFCATTTPEFEVPKPC